MKEGDVIVVPMPQANAMIKNRPAIILREMPPFGDMLVCGVSTQLHQAAPDFDDLISMKDPDFVSSGLKAASLIRLGFLDVVPRNKIAGSIGTISFQRRKRLLQTLSNFLVK